MEREKRMRERKGEENEDNEKVKGEEQEVMKIETRRAEEIQETDRKK